MGLASLQLRRNLLNTTTPKMSDEWGSRFGNLTYKVSRLDTSSMRFANQQPLLLMNTFFIESVLMHKRGCGFTHLADNLSSPSRL